MSERRKRNRKGKSKDGGGEIIRDLQDLDVLMGRESLDSFHTGTVRLLAAIDASLPEYARAAGRASKTRIIKGIYRNAATVTIRIPSYAL